MDRPARIPVGAPDLEEHWDPQVFCGPGAAIALTEGTRVSLRELGGTCLEGERPEIEDEEGISRRVDRGPIYRQANLGVLRFLPDPEHWSTPAYLDPNDPDERKLAEKCVEPGDVVLNKMEPIRAAWATAGIHRHLVDANCILIKWRKDVDLFASTPFIEREVRKTAFWVAVCLNHPSYQHYLLRRSGAAILPRVRISVLQKLRLPLPPEAAEQLSGLVWAWLDETLANEQELARLLGQVDEEVEGMARAALADDDAGEVAAEANRWHRFFQAGDVTDSLIPRHVALGHLEQSLRRRKDWAPLQDLLGPKQPSRLRMTETAPGQKYLRLSNVGSDLAIMTPDDDAQPPSPFRIFAEPLRPDEVLLSLLVTSPRVAFAESEPSANLFVTDHWERFDFRDTPGAWALVLNTAIVRRQLRLMAMGTVQQFTHPESLRGLVLPEFPLEQRLKWDHALRRLLGKRRELETQGKVFWNQSLALFAKAHESRRQAWHVMEAKP